MMKALDFILENYQEEKYQNSYVERMTLKALVHALNEKEMAELQKRIKPGHATRSVARELNAEVSRVLKKRVPQKNESIATLLKYFTDSRSGKVMDARKKLWVRFYRQSFLDQRKILQAMLRGSKQDRIWAYGKLERQWDQYLFDEVKRVWEEYHEQQCIAVVTKYFPLDYLYEHQEELNFPDNYISYCIRMVHHPSFSINMDRLSELVSQAHIPGLRPFSMGSVDSNYLYILAESKSKVEKGVATKLLFRNIANFVRLEYEQYDEQRKVMELEKRLVEGKISTKYLPLVDEFLKSMGELGLAEELIAFEEWDNMVKERYLKDERLNSLVQDSSIHYAHAALLLFAKVIDSCLPEEFQIDKGFDIFKGKNFSREFILSNPNVKELIDKLDLRVKEE